MLKNKVLRRSNWVPGGVSKSFSKMNSRRSILLIVYVGAQGHMSQRGCGKRRGFRTGRAGIGFSLRFPAREDVTWLATFIFAKRVCAKLVTVVHKNCVH